MINAGSWVVRVGYGLIKAINFAIFRLLLFFCGLIFIVFVSGFAFPYIEIEGFF